MSEQVIVVDNATGRSEERQMDRAYTEAGLMTLKEYVDKWGCAL